jgi:hypothetical protein
MVRFYADENVNGAIVRGARRRGVDILTAVEDRYAGKPDPEIMDRATVLGRALFTQDEDLLAEAARRQANGIAFSGVLYAQQDQVSIGQCVRDLELAALAGSAEDFADQVYFSPL